MKHPCRDWHPCHSVDELDMEREVLREYIQAPCFQTQHQCQAYWSELVPISLGQAQSPANWC